MGLSDVLFKQGLLFLIHGLSSISGIPKRVVFLWLLFEANRTRTPYYAVTHRTWMRKCKIMDMHLGCSADIFVGTLLSVDGAQKRDCHR